MLVVVVMAVVLVAVALSNGTSSKIYLIAAVIG